jgi:hypothetical protein
MGTRKPGFGWFSGLRVTWASKATLKSPARFNLGIQLNGSSNDVGGPQRAIEKLVAGYLTSVQLGVAACKWGHTIARQWGDLFFTELR